MIIADILTYAFIQNAYIAGSFVAALAGMLGLLLVLRKWSLIGDGLAHVSFGAIALGMVLGIYPLGVAVPVSVLASLIVWKLSEKASLYGDAAIGIVSAGGIALGVILASVSHGFNVDLFSYLFGNILAVGRSEIIISIALSAIVAVSIALFYHDFFTTTFDEPYARVIGINTGFVQGLLMVLTAITVVLAVKIVGVMLVSAMLVIPAVTALQNATSFRSAMALSVGVGVLSVIVGITISLFADIPAGATIVMVMIALFLFALGWKKTK
ncbi:MAG: metal ABC transporter permease [Candidatus Yonathbacteria bacterium]|nr:metal ABC transporter permease [Candidatus Yonathbacteria bacterium]